MKTPLQFKSNLPIITFLFLFSLVIKLSIDCAPTTVDSTTTPTTPTTTTDQTKPTTTTTTTSWDEDDKTKPLRLTIEQQEQQPQPPLDVDEVGQQQQQNQAELDNDDESMSSSNHGGATNDDSQQHPQQPHQQQQQQQLQEQKIDYYKYRHIFADGVQRALNECRDKFKWDRWNCPKKAFLAILDNDEHSNLPSNKELGLIWAWISSSMVLSMLRSCSTGLDSSLCGCGSTATNLVGQDLPATNALVRPTACSFNDDSGEPQAAPASGNDSYLMNPNNDHNHHQQQSNSLRTFPNVSPVVDPASTVAKHSSTSSPPTPNCQGSNKFSWFSCEQTVQLSFKVARMYLTSLDQQQDAASRLISAHNYKVGLQAIKRTMKRRCKCHGASGTCQFKTCWTIVPTMSEVGDYLKQQYRVAAKVGSHSAKETDPSSLNQELTMIGLDKLVFADSSPDYCYENKQLGVNGTLERYCSRAKYRPDGSEVSRSERDSCDRLCTKCGYKIKKIRLNVEKQCDCRFVYCCSVECKRCPYVEEAYKCVRHS